MQPITAIDEKNVWTSRITVPEGRRGLDAKTVDDMVKALARDGRFLHPITVCVSDKFGLEYTLICGRHRLAAWRQHFGDSRPIPAVCYPADTPTARWTVLELEENLVRVDLTTDERLAAELRLTAALKELDKPPTELAVSTRGGRGRKGMVSKVAEVTGKSKQAVAKDVKLAEEKIGEKVDLDQDPPAELKRKATAIEASASKPEPAMSKSAINAAYGKKSKSSSGPTPPTTTNRARLWISRGIAMTTHDLVHVYLLNANLEVPITERRERLAKDLQIIRATIDAALSQLNAKGS
jgi:hypothetical protein